MPGSSKSGPRPGGPRHGAASTRHCAIAAWAACVIVAILAASCSSGYSARRLSRSGGHAVATQEPGLELGLAVESLARTVELQVPSPRGPEIARLGATLVRPRSGSGPGVVIVPGGGDVSRRGTRASDGVGLYGTPVDVSVRWAEALARRGARVLAYDKRTCGPNDDALCTVNPRGDVDAQGPVALARDVDAACALLRAEPGFDGRLVLLAHGQAAQVALSSRCARDAAALVLLSPIPRGVDRVIVAGLKQRHRDALRAAHAAGDAAKRQWLEERALELKNAAATREAEFASMRAGRFAPGSRVGGATLGFWQGWIALTARTRDLVAPAAERVVWVLGELDRQVGDEDRAHIHALPAATLLEVKGADHHLLHAGGLAPATVDAVAEAIDRVLAATAS